MAAALDTAWPSLAQIPKPRLRYAALAAGCTLACCGLTTLYYWDPASAGGLQLCPLHALTGYYCPGCGTLRGIHQLLHGNLATALAYNPVMVLAVPLAVYLLCSEIVAVGWNKRLPKPDPSPRLLWGLLCFLIAFGILRNIPCYPLTLLAPH